MFDEYLQKGKLALEKIEKLERKVRVLEDRVMESERELYGHYFRGNLSLRKKIHLIMDYLDVTYQIPEKQEIKLIKREVKSD